MPINLSDYTLDGYRTSYDKIKTSSYFAHECGTFFRRIVYISHWTELITREAIDWKNASNEFQLKGIYHENALSILFEIFLLFFFRNKFNADKKKQLETTWLFSLPRICYDMGSKLWKSLKRTRCRQKERSQSEDAREEKELRLWRKCNEMWIKW